MRRRMEAGSLNLRGVVAALTILSREYENDEALAVVPAAARA